jgi:hypothetical protein
VARFHVTLAQRSDPGLPLADARRLPRFTVGDRVRLKQVTLILRAGTMAAAHAPLFPPDADAASVLGRLTADRSALRVASRAQDGLTANI